MEGRGGEVRRWWSRAEMGRSDVVESGGKKGKGIRVYKFNPDYMASIKWVVKLPINARVLSSTRLKGSETEPNKVETHLIKKNDLIEKDNCGENQNAPTFNQIFKINDLKAHSQEKDTFIRKFKDKIKSLSGKDSVENVKKDVDEIETINIELEYSVAKLLSENENLRKYQEHLKSIYKDQFDSIRKIRVQSKEHSASLITQINEKYVENLDLNAQLQEKVFAIVALKNKLRKLKGKNVVETVVSKPIATIAAGMFKLDIEPISHRLKNNREAHKVYLENTIENTDTLRRLVECARKQNPSEP
uniref:Pyruvate, phosphate dikinase regulatory protein, chloroplastic n=1 Tax=Tanacetum cinerariifolium TaxID=118510 RepID=A0A699GKE5_TANCI|nr:hypothetical protein [Tanacetum cinerariifolium]